AVKYLVPPPCHFYAEASPNVAKPQSYYSHPQTTIPFSLQDPPLLQIMFLPFYQLFTLVSDNIPFLSKYDQESAHNFISYTFLKLLSHKLIFNINYGIIIVPPLPSIACSILSKEVMTAFLLFECFTNSMTDSTFGSILPEAKCPSSM